MKSTRVTMRVTDESIDSLCADSIFSPESSSSSTTSYSAAGDAIITEALNFIPDILCNSKLTPILKDDLLSLSNNAFHRKLHPLIRVFARDLKLVACSELEILIAGLVKSRSRGIVTNMRLNLQGNPVGLMNPGGPLDRFLESRLQDDKDQGYDSMLQLLDSYDSDDETDELLDPADFPTSISQLTVKEFLLNSAAFESLCESLEKPRLCTDTNQKYNSARYRVRNEIRASLSTIMGTEFMILDDETLFSWPKSICASVIVWIGDVFGFSVSWWWLSLFKLGKRQEGTRLASWSCKCGKLFFGYIPKDLAMRYQEEVARNKLKRLVIPNYLNQKSRLCEPRFLIGIFLLILWIPMQIFIAHANNMSTSTKNKAILAQGAAVFCATYAYSRSIISSIRCYINCAYCWLKNSLPRPKPTSSGQDHFVLFCMDRLASRQTVVEHIELSPVDSRSDGDFFRTLGCTYRRLQGKRRFWTFKAVSQIRFVKFERYYLSNVSCESKQQLPPYDNPEYQYKVVRDEPPPISPEEMMHFFESPSCVDHDTQCLERIPKRIQGRLPEGRVTGWGLQAQATFCFRKISTFMAFVVICTIGFVPYWLSYHPGDIQGAFTPATWVIGLFAVCIILPQYLESQHAQSTA